MTELHPGNIALSSMLRYYEVMFLDLYTDVNRTQGQHCPPKTKADGYRTTFGVAPMITSAPKFLGVAGSG